MEISLLTVTKIWEIKTPIKKKNSGSSTVFMTGVYVDMNDLPGQRLSPK